MKRIMFAGDSLALTTGLSYVLASLMIRFANEKESYEIAYCNLAGDDVNSFNIGAHGDEFLKAFQKMPLFNAQVHDQSKNGAFDSAISAFKPDVVFTVLDPWSLDAVAFSRFRDSYVWISYMTIETPFYPDNVHNILPVLNSPRKSLKTILSKADLIIPVTEMGKTVLDRLGARTCENIYCGLDLDSRVVDPVKKSDAFGPGIDENSFVFMSMGVNTERKRLDFVVEAFHRFLKTRKDAGRYRLYLHTDMRTLSGGTDLVEQVSVLGLSQVVLQPHNYRIGRGIKREELYKRYRASDCYISLPSGEGFGYGFAESLLHGVPVIYTNYGGHVEYCKRGGLAASVAAYVHARGAYIKWAIADLDDTVKHMIRLSSDKILRESLGAKGQAYVMKNMGWEHVYPQIKKKVDDLTTTRHAFMPGLMMRRIV